MPGQRVRRFLPGLGWAVLVVLAAWFYVSYLHYYPTAASESLAPDGEYRIGIKERSSSGQSFTIVRVERRDGPQSDKWHAVYTARVDNDSLPARPYAVDWEYDDRFRTTGARVFGHCNASGYGPFVRVVLRLDRQSGEWTSQRAFLGPASSATREE
jgi:hypothetical protein